MNRLLPALLFLIAASAPSAGGVVCEFDAVAVKSTLTIRNLCAEAGGFKMWKINATDFAVVCTGHAPPAGAVELREFYDFKMWGS